MTTGEQIGAAVDGAVQTAEQSAQAQIEAARADADASARQAKAIADAAISTELGNQIQSTRQEFETWRTAQDQRMAEISATNQRSEAALADTTTLLGSIRALLTPAPAAPKLPTSEQNPVQAQTVANSTGTVPNEKPATVPAETQPAAAPRKRHFL